MVLFSFICSPAAAQVDDNLLPTGGFGSKELTNNDINSFESQPVATVDEGGSSLKLIDKVAEEVWLIRVIESFHTTLGNNTTAICLWKGKRGSAYCLYR